jgi:hypothetical protein
MTIDEQPQPPAPQPETLPAAPYVPSPETPPVIPGAIPSQAVEPKKSNKKLWIIMGIVLGVLACCCLIAVVATGMGVISSAREKYPVEKVLDSYMYAMKIKNAERAYEMFSPRAQRQIPISKIQELFEGNNYVLFDGYQSLSVKTIKIAATVNTNPDLPQGTVATVTGTIAYQDGIEGTFNGTLEKVEDTWRIDGIYVHVPPSKFK